MIKKLHSVVIWTEELGRLVPFYRDVLGLQQEMDTPEFAMFASEDGPQLAIGTHSEVHGRSGDPYRVMVDFQVDDCQAEYERLKGQGVEFIRPPRARTAARGSAIMRQMGSFSSASPRR